MKVNSKVLHDGFFFIIFFDHENVCEVFIRNVSRFSKDFTDVTTQNINPFITTAVRTSNPGREIQSLKS
jgi:hypothetical protein